MSVADRENIQSYGTTQHEKRSSSTDTCEE